ncbi:MAG TPA: Ig-like domain-containing protein [Roseiflexaceae bacterium]|nr:Ig-like domain-containing protein [Roseiflexaceae bacterium]
MRILRWACRVWTGVLLATVLGSALLLALRFLLPLFSPPSGLRSSLPADGAADVSPRAPLELRFDSPMNPRSVERALALEPPAPLLFRWSPDRATLAISPTQGLLPDTSYRLRLGAGASSRLLRPLDAPLELTFRTTPAPDVAATLPADGASDVPPGSAISMRFSRPIVPPEAVGRPATLPALRFSPPLSGTLTWLDQATLLFRPDAPLLLGTRYEGTLDAALTDLGGVPLGRPFGWSFSTPAPAVLAVSPGDGAQGVAPQTPLVLRLSQPLDPDLLQQSLTISPTVAGAAVVATLPDATQVVTFTPTAGWQPGQTYRAELRAGVPPLAGNLPLAEPTAWGFRAAPAPQVVGRFPGEGQTLPAGQDLRLIFATPVDPEALRAGLRFDPPVGGLRVGATDSEASIGADFRAATAYTLTLPAELADRNGTPLGQPYRARFVTAPAVPTLVLPEVANHISQQPPGPLGLLVRRINLSRIDLALYRLDEATVVRTLDFREGDWASFSPERYGQALLRSWSVPLEDPLNQQTNTRLTVAISEGVDLPAGAYYLRLRTPEGPRADALLLLAGTRLLWQSGLTGALVWATDAQTGAARPGLPVALYQGGALLQRGATDAAGVWALAGLTLDPRLPFVAVAADGGLAAVSSAGAPGLPAPDPFLAAFVTDRAVYRPGERVGLAGFVRAASAAGLEPPPAGTSLTLSVRPTGAPTRVYEATISLSSTGTLSAAFDLPADAPPGDYLAVAGVGATNVTRRFAVLPPEPPLLVRALAPDGFAGEPVPARVQVQTPEGLPVAGVTISWTVRAEPLTPPAPLGLIIGDDERRPLPSASSGVTQTGPDGWATVVISDTVEARQGPLRYRLEVRATEPGGPTVVGDATFTVAPAQVEVGLRLPAQVLPAGQPQTVELLALAGGQPLRRATVRVDLYRRGASGAQPTSDGASSDVRVLQRTLSTDDQGVAELTLNLRNGGEYRLVASAGDAAGRTARSAATVWVSAAGFTGWRTLDGDRVLLIADQPTYRPGDTARLLVAAPFAAADVLVAVQSGGVLTGTVRPLRAGELISVPIPADAPPAFPVAVRLIEQRSAAGGRVLAVATGLVVLPVRSDARALTVAVSSERADYAPGATATLTVTTTDPQGQPVAADVALAIGACLPAGDSCAASGQAAPEAPGALPALEPLFAGAAQDHTARTATLLWAPALRTAADGTLTVTLNLPDEATALEAHAWAAGAARFGQARATFAVSTPLQLAIDAPPFLRAGDALSLTARLHNTSPITQDLLLTLTSNGIRPGSGGPLRQIVLAPGEQRVEVWSAGVGEPRPARLTLRASTGGRVLAEATLERPILPAATAEQHGLLVGGRVDLPVAPAAPRGQILIDLAPNERALALSTARTLAGHTPQSQLDTAGLLLISAALSDTRPLARAALDRLRASQNGDGGWGWWPGEPTQPFVTATVLEALATARRAGLAVNAGVIDAALGSLEAADRTPAVQAQIAYVSALLGRPTADQPADLGDLGAESLALLLLADPPDDQTERALVERLVALALRDEQGVHWPPEPGPRASDSVSATGLAAQALRRASPDSDVLPEARRWLAGTRGVAGWADGYRSARALAALQALAGSPVARRSTLALSDAQGRLLASASPLSSTAQLTLTLDRLAPRGTLAVTSSTGPAFLAYSIAPAAQPPDNGFVLRELLDPQTGRLLDPGVLRPGQLLRVRLTLVSYGERRFLTHEELLPSGARLLAVSPGDLRLVARDPDRLTFARQDMPPGVYTADYLLRATIPGQFAGAQSLLVRER